MSSEEAGGDLYVKDELDPLLKPEEAESEDEENPIYETPLVLGQLFILSLASKERPDPLLVKLVAVSESKGATESEQTVTFQDEENQELICLYTRIDDRYALLLTTPSYEILEILRVRVHDIDQVAPEPEEEVTLDTEILYDKIYPEFQKVDDVLSYLIQSRGVYHKPYLIKQMQRIASVLLDLSRSPEVPLYGTEVSWNDSIYEDTGPLIPPYLIPLSIDPPKRYESDTLLKEELEAQRHDSYRNLVISCLQDCQSLVAGTGYGIQTTDYTGPVLHDSEGSYELLRFRRPTRVPIVPNSFDENTHFQEITNPPPLTSVGFLYLEPNHPLAPLSPSGSLSHQIQRDTHTLPIRRRSSDYLSQVFLFDISLTGTEAMPLEDDLGSETLRTYRVDAPMDPPTLREALRLHLPTLHQICLDTIQKYPKTLHNIRDVQELSGYSYERFSSEDRSRFQKALAQNHKGKTVSPSPPPKTSVSLSLKIYASLRFIKGISEDEIRREYLSRFIEVFCRNADKSHESSQWWYDKSSHQRLVCKHYQLECKCRNDNDVFQTMVSRYGLPPEDGKISCKVCGETLCEEDASLIEGYSEGARIISKQAMDTPSLETEIEEYLLKKPTQTQVLREISGTLGYAVPDHVLYAVLMAYDYLNHDELADLRYGLLGVSHTDIHPHVQAKIQGLRAQEATEIKGTRDKPTIKKIKVSYKHQRETLIHEFQEWLKATNKVLVWIALLTLCIQTSLPPLSSTRNFELRVVDFGETPSVDSDHLKWILSRVHKLCQGHADTPIWSEFLGVLAEGSESNNALTQLENTLQYTLSPTFPTIRTRAERYRVFLVAETKRYLRPDWPTYKPLAGNQFLLDLATYVESTDYRSTLRTQYSGPLIENQALVRTTRASYEVSVAQECQISYTELLQNQAFLRIFRYGVSCYGIHPSHPMMTLLFQELLVTTTDRERVLAVLKKHGWNERNQTFPKLNFKVLRTKVIPEILQMSQGSSELRSCVSEETTCNHFIHSAINSYDLPLLNTFPKRVYPYRPACVYPALPFARLQKESPALIERLCSLYRYNGVDEFIRYQRDLSCLAYRLKISGDVPVPEMSYRALPRNEATFHELQEFRQRKTLLPYLPIVPPSSEYTPADYQRVELLAHNEGRFLEWLSRYEVDSLSEYLEVNRDLYAYLAHYLSALTEGTIVQKPLLVKQEFKTYLSRVRETQESLCESVARFMAQSRYFEASQKQRFLSIFRHVDQIQVPNLKQTTIQSVLGAWLRDPAQTSETLQAHGAEIRRVLVLISGETGLNREDAFAFPIQQTVARWKVPESTATRLESFSLRPSVEESPDGAKDRYDLLLHNRLYVAPRKDRYSGFQREVRTHPHAPMYLRALKNYLGPTLQDLSLMQSTGTQASSIYTPDLALSYLQYHLMVIFQKTVDYIEGIQDAQSEISRDANEIFVSLEELHEEWVRGSVEVCTHWLIDMITHLLFRHYDPFWIPQNQSENALQKRLSKQKEREKQTLISTLDSLSNEERYLLMQKQQAGLSNFYRETAEIRREFAQSDEYARMNEEERREYLQNISLGTDEMVELIQGEVPETHPPFHEAVPLGSDEEDEGYLGMDDIQEEGGEDYLGHLDEEQEPQFNE